MKKILFIMHYPPPVHGASMVGQYIKDSKLVNDTFTGRYVNLGTSVTVDEIGFGGWSKLIRYLKIVFRVLRQLIFFRPDLVYFTLTATGGGFFKDATVVLLAHLFGKKVVHHMHNKGVKLHQDRWYYDICYRMVFRGAHVILLSSHLYGDIEKYVPHNRVYFCPNGVPDESIEMKVAETPGQGIHILYLSNLIESKGIFDVLAGCRKLKSDGMNFKCTIVGGEADISGNRLEEAIQELGLQREVDYVGKKYGKEKALAYSKADVFVFPTFYSNECFPLVLLEAMQYSLPIISTYEGGIRDIVDNGKTGYLIEARNIAQLAERIKELAVDADLRTQLGVNARQRYEKEFTLSTFESKITNILSKIVG